MKLARLFQHRGSQAVLLPEGFQFEGSEVSIERRGEEVVLKACLNSPGKTLSEVAKYMRENFPQGVDFPDIERPTAQQERDLDLDA